MKKAVEIVIEELLTCMVKLGYELLLVLIEEDIILVEKKSILMNLMNIKELKFLRY